MKLTVSTQVLQSLLSKAIKGATCNKMIPITNLLLISVQDSTLSLVTTDATNYLYVTYDGSIEDNFYCVVPIDIFYKLVSKFTCTDVTLDVSDNLLNVCGNGKYTIELPLDEEGAPVKFPNPISSVDLENCDEFLISASTIDQILTVAKPSLSTAPETPCYMGYYIGDSVVTTDTFTICGIDKKLFDKPVLFSSEYMNLLGVLDADVRIYFSGSTVIAKSKFGAAFGKTLDSIGDYQIGAITELLTEDFDSVCKVSKTLLMQTLDRLNLFVGVYDKNGICLTFGNDAITVTSKRSNGAESIPYISSENSAPFSCLVDIEMLVSQIKPNSTDEITMCFGNDNALKLIDGDTTHIIALLD